MPEPIRVPDFSRIHDWCGLWAMEPIAFAALRELVARTDFGAHMAAPVRKLESGIVPEPAKGGKTVARINVVGPLMKSAGSFGGTSTVQLRRDIRQAAADPQFSGIMLAIDSPGGTVAGTMELGDEVRAARRQKPVHAFVDGMAASAAYWVASQADAVWARNAMAHVGSIGTYYSVVDSSQAAEREGVKVHLFTTGPLKGIGAPGVPVTDDQVAHLREWVDELQAHFDDAVRKGRGLSAAELAAVRSGEVFPATRALGKRLIDGIKTEDQVVNALATAR